MGMDRGMQGDEKMGKDRSSLLCIGRSNRVFVCHCLGLNL